MSVERMSDERLALIARKPSVATVEDLSQMCNELMEECRRAREAESALRAFVLDVLDECVLTDEPGALEWDVVLDFARKNGLIEEVEVPGDCGMECSGRPDPHPHYFATKLVTGEKGDPGQTHHCPECERRAREQEERP